MTARLDHHDRAQGRVSHALNMGDEWPPERTERVEHRTLYAWTIRPEHKRL